MTNRLRPRLQPPAAALLAPATFSQKKQINTRASVLRSSLHAGTALLDATDDTLACSLTSENKRSILLLLSSCITGARNPAHGSSLGFVASQSRSASLCTCLREQNDFTGRADRVRKARFHVRKASKASQRKCVASRSP